jgi:hypothetical protein
MTAGMEATCPKCGTGHLHVNVLIEADTPASRFVATGLADNGQDVVIVMNESGQLAPDTAFVSCCACDWNDERPIRISHG